MFYSLVFTINGNINEILEKIYSEIVLSPNQYQVVFLTNKEISKVALNSNKINYKIFTFEENATKEEMFESFIQTENLNNIILFKNPLKNFDFKAINKMIQSNQDGQYLIISKQEKQQNLIIKYLQKFKNFFIKLFFGIKLYPGEADIILLDSVLVSTLKEMKGKSNILTKANGWIGIEPKVIQIEKQNNQKSYFNVKNYILPICITFFFLCLITGNILFSVFNVQLPFLAYFSYLIFEILILGLIIYTTLKSNLICTLGNLKNVNPAKIIDIYDNFDF